VNRMAAIYLVSLAISLMVLAFIGAVVAAVVGL